VSGSALRICHIAYTFYDSDNRVMRYVQGLANRGDRVDVVCLRERGQAWRDVAGQVRVYRIQRRSATERRMSTYLFKILLFCLKATFLLCGLQLRRRYDVVHVHNVPDFLVFAAWLPKLMGVRIILDIHDILPELYAGKFNGGAPSIGTRMLARMERACCHFADHVIVANDLWYHTLTARSVPPSRCTAILNYPDLSVFRPAATGAPRPTSRYMILYPGSLNFHQGVDIAVRALAAARPYMPEAELHIYGSGPELPRLTRLVDELGLERVVKFSDSVSLACIAEVIASASVGIVPKRADGFGNEAFSTKILEFMACGVPVIVSRTRIDLHYFTEDLVSFFEPGDVYDLARVLLWTYQHPEEQCAKVLAAREFAVRHSWQVRSGGYRGLIDSLVDGRRDPRQGGAERHAIGAAAPSDPQRHRVH
jgi:glycosyltransferase involved in cell wall biosynthesis